MGVPDAVGKEVVAPGVGEPLPAELHATTIKALTSDATSRHCFTGVTIILQRPERRGSRDGEEPLILRPRRLSQEYRIRPLPKGYGDRKRAREAANIPLLADLPGLIPVSGGVRGRASREPGALDPPATPEARG